ncbi:MAG: hypothetical protein JU82_06490 [Sulfuricurvum sp. MLSB]|nr:MAG: hypothetical protein JU82_06490 [Sulfuricurvum sp. MLSB]
MKKILDFIGLFTREEIKDIIRKIIFKPLSSKLVLGGLTILITPFWQPILIEYLNKTFSLNLSNTSDTFVGIFLVVLGVLTRWYELYLDVKKQIFSKTQFKPSIEWAKEKIELALKSVEDRYITYNTAEYAELNIDTKTKKIFEYVTCIDNFDVNDFIKNFKNGILYYLENENIYKLEYRYQLLNEWLNTYKNLDNPPEPHSPIESMYFITELFEQKFFQIKDSYNDVLIIIHFIESLEKNRHYQLHTQELKEAINSLQNIQYISKKLLSDMSETIHGLLPYQFEYLNAIQHYAEYSTYLYPLLYFFVENNYDTASLNNNINQNNCLSTHLYKYSLISGEALSGKTHTLCDIANDRIQKKLPTVLIFGQKFYTNESPIKQIIRQLDLEHHNLSEDEFLETLNSWGENEQQLVFIIIDAINEVDYPQIWQNFFIEMVEKIKKRSYLALIMSVRDTEKEKIFNTRIRKYISEELIEIEHNGLDQIDFETIQKFSKVFKFKPIVFPWTSPLLTKPGWLFLVFEALKDTGINSITPELLKQNVIMEKFIKGVNDRFKRSKALTDHRQYVISTTTVASKKIVNNNFIETVSYDELKNDTQYLHEAIVDYLLSEGIFLSNIGRFDIRNIYFAYQKFGNYFLSLYLLSIVSEQDDKPSIIRKISQDTTIQLLFQKFQQHQALIADLITRISDDYQIDIIEIFPQLTNNPTIDQLRLSAYTISSKLPESLQNVVKNLLSSTEKERYEFFEAQLYDAVNFTVDFNIQHLHSLLISDRMSNRDIWWGKYVIDSYQNEGVVSEIIFWAQQLSKEEKIDTTYLVSYSTLLAWFLISSNRELRDKTTKALVNLLADHIDIVIAVLKEFEGVDDPYVYERLFAVAFGSAIRSKTTDHLKELCEYIYHTIFDQEFVYPHILLRDYAKNTIDYAIYKEISLDINREKTIPPYKSHFPEHLPTNEEIDALVETFDDPDYGLSSIISSMTTEYGRGGEYGDFGRYTFQSALRDWEKQINIDFLSNHAVKMIIQRIGYNPLHHGKLEKNITSGYGYSRYENKAERIGKKYQWIMFFEILAQITDKYPVYGNYEEKEPYRGTFSPYVRDIDPTILIQKTHKNSSHIIENWWHPIIELDWNTDNNLWAVSDHDLPPVEPFIMLTDERGVEWFCLNTILDWNEKVPQDDDWKTPRKKLYYMVQSYLIKNDQLGELISWGQKEDQNFFGRWMPDNGDRYELFDREHCWSEGTQYFYGHIWENIRNTDFEVIPTAYHYWWEESNDYSKESSLGFLKPTKVIFDALNMQYGDEDGSLYDQENQRICFDPSAQIESPSMLLIQKDKFLNFLKENNLSLFWTVIGEKMIVGGDDRKNTERSVYSGFYRLDDNQVKGKIKCVER